MFSRVRLCLGGALVAVAFTMGSTAGAVTVDLQTTRYTKSQLPTAQAAMADFLSSHAVSDQRLETFQGYKAWNGTKGKANPQNTKVGSFTAVGHHGSGHSVVSNGKHAQVRDDVPMKWGRYNTDAGAGNNKWLDSNDATGIKWKVGGIGSFNTLAFFVTDAADVGGKFSIKVNGQLYSDIAGGDGKLKNGNIQLVRILLDETVDKLTVVLKHDRTNDGFGIDGLTVGNIAPVPLPPAAALLVTGLLGFAGLRRRAARAA